MTVDLEFGPEMGNALYEQVVALWIDPEVARRGDLDRSEVHRALVLMTDPPTVRLNSEVDVVATVVAARAITAGEEVTEQDFTEVKWTRPADIDPNLGWILYVVVGSKAFVSFDLRHNRATAAEMLKLADDYLATAKAALDAGRQGPAIDCALSAAELTVKADTYLLGLTNIQHHKQRLNFWSGWVNLGNAPEHTADTFARLTAERPAARYADRPIDLTEAEIRAALSEVEEMVSAVRQRAADTSPSPVRLTLWPFAEKVDTGT